MPYEGKYAKRRSSDKQNEPPQKTGFFGQFLDNHVRLIAAVCTVIVLLGIGMGIEALMTADFRGGNDKGEAITMNVLNGLSEKTSPITWKDLERFSYDTVSENKSDDGTYVLRRYAVEGGVLSVVVGGFTEGEGFTGNIAYAEVKHHSDFDFSFSLLEDEDLSGYLEQFSDKK